MLVPRKIAIGSNPGAIWGRGSHLGHTLAAAPGGLKSDGANGLFVLGHLARQISHYVRDFSEQLASKKSKRSNGAGEVIARFGVQVDAPTHGCKGCGATCK